MRVGLDKLGKTIISNQKAMRIFFLLGPTPNFSQPHNCVVTFMHHATLRGRNYKYGTSRAQITEHDSGRKRKCSVLGEHVAQ